METLHLVSNTLWQLVRTNQEEILTDEGQTLLHVWWKQPATEHNCSENQSLPPTDWWTGGEILSDPEVHGTEVRHGLGAGLGQVATLVLFAYREVPQASTGFSPFEPL